MLIDNVHFYNLGPRLLSVWHTGTSEARFSAGCHHRQWVTRNYRQPSCACHNTSRGLRQEQWTWMTNRFDLTEVLFYPSTEIFKLHQFQLGSNGRPASAILRCDTATHFLSRHSLAIHQFFHWLWTRLHVQNTSVLNSRAKLSGAHQTFVNHEGRYGNDIFWEKPTNANAVIFVSL